MESNRVRIAAIWEECKRLKEEIEKMDKERRRKEDDTARTTKS